MSQPFFPPILTGSSACEYAQPYPRATLKPSQFALVERVSSPLFGKNPPKRAISGDIKGNQEPINPSELALTPGAGLIALEEGAGKVRAFKACEQVLKAIAVIGNL